MNITKLHFINMIRSRGFIIALLMLFLASLLSLYIGKTFIDNHRKNIHNTSLVQQENIDRYVKYENEEMGLLLYYLKFGLVNEMSNLTGLSIGQRDIHSSLKKVTIRNIEEQKYENELNNPLYQLLGNMDFSFILIYFFPLVIISFCFNVLSEENESGIWKLICSQTSKPFLVIINKIAIRFVVIEFTLIIILLIAQFYLQIPFNFEWVIFCLIAILYILFWFAVCTWIVSFQKKSNQNALSLLLFWILFTIVFPATANALVTKKYPIHESFETQMKSRDGYHKKWDIGKEPTIQKFKAIYPQFAAFSHPEGKEFSWLWYYAMQQMGDEDAKKSVKEFKEKLANRDKLSKCIGYFIPSIHSQLVFNQLSQSDLTNQLQFWEALEEFHEQKKGYFYPKIFSGSPVLQEDWSKWKLNYYNNKPVINCIGIFLPILLITVLFFIVSAIQFRKIRI